MPPASPTVDQPYQKAEELRPGSPGSSARLGQRQQHCRRSQTHAPARTQACKPPSQLQRAAPTGRRGLSRWLASIEATELKIRKGMHKPLPPPQKETEPTSACLPAPGETLPPAQAARASSAVLACSAVLAAAAATAALGMGRLWGLGELALVGTHWFASEWSGREQREEDFVREAQCLPPPAPSPWQNDSLCLKSWAIPSL